MEITKQRQGEIAYALIKAKAKKDGVRYELIKRELGQVSKEVGVSPEDLLEFMRILNLELHEETFKTPGKYAEHRISVPHPDGPFSKK